MKDLLAIAAQNTIVAGILAILVYGLTRVSRRPPVAHLLWLVVLAKLIGPPVLPVDVMGLFAARSRSSPATAAGTWPRRRCLRRPVAVRLSRGSQGPRRAIPRQRRRRTPSGILGRRSSGHPGLMAQPLHNGHRSRPPPREHRAHRDRSGLDRRIGPVRSDRAAADHPVRSHDPRNAGSPAALASHGRGAGREAGRAPRSRSAADRRRWRPHGLVCGTPADHRLAGRLSASSTTSRRRWCCRTNWPISPSRSLGPRGRAGDFPALLVEPDGRVGSPPAPSGRRPVLRRLGRVGLSGPEERLCRGAVQGGHAGRTYPPPAPALASSFLNHGVLKGRIEAVLEGGRPRQVSPGAALFLAATAIVLLPSFMPSVPAADAIPPAASPSQAQDRREAPAPVRGKIEGTVTVEGTNEPVSGATVRVMLGRQTNGLSRSTTTRSPRKRTRTGITQSKRRSAICAIGRFDAPCRDTGP